IKNITKNGAVKRYPHLPLSDAIPVTPFAFLGFGALLRQGEVGV
ncbi:MAG: hypothetical protein RIS80_981, partial [Actinomycetota bacterium]